MAFGSNRPVFEQYLCFVLVVLPSQKIALSLCQFTCQIERQN